MSDPVDEAVAAASQPQQQVRMTQRQVNISSTGRPFVFAHPVDMTDAELFEVVGWLASGFRMELMARSQRPSARLIVPVGSRLPT